MRETEAIAAELDDLYQEFAKQAKERQRDSGGDRGNQHTGGKVAVSQKFDQPPKEKKSEQVRTSATRAAKAVGVGSTAVKQAKRVER